MPKARKPEDHNTDAYAGFVSRVLRAYGRRVADGDVESLAGLVELRAQVDQAIEAAVDELTGPSWGYSWTDIARGLGTTRQYAHRRYGKTAAS